MNTSSRVLRVVIQQQLSRSLSSNVSVAMDEKSGRCNWYLHFVELRENFAFLHVPEKAVSCEKLIQVKFLPFDPSFDIGKSHLSLLEGQT